MSWTLITGASSGLGREFARIASEQRRKIILTARSKARLEELAEELRGEALEVEVIPVDLSKPKGAEKLWQQATAIGEIEILVNNAGFGLNDRFDNADTWGREQEMIALNITALTYLFKQAVAHMKAAGGGRIMNVSSISGFMPGPSFAVYHASKSYVLSLSESVAEEVKDNNITVTAVCPGVTETAFFETAKMEGSSVKKIAKPADAAGVARAAWFAMLEGKRVFVPGFVNKTGMFLMRFLPRRLVAYGVGRVMRSRYK